MVKINDSFAQAGGKALTVMKLKELGSKVEREAWRLYNVLEDGSIPLDLTDTMIPDGQPPAKGCPGFEEFWWSLLPNGSHINSMDPEGNCLFCSLSNQLNHDNGQAHDFTHHQITNHIKGTVTSSKIFSFSGITMKTSLTLTGISKKKVQNGEWGATLNYMLQPGCMMSTSQSTPRSTPILMGC
jgi:hypothetical protein